MADLTYFFQGDQVHAIHDGKVVASGKSDDVKDVESDATNYLQGLKNEADEKRKKSATHVVTPNGLKGKIQNRVASVWGEEITVRFENGEVTTFSAHGVKDWVTERTASSASPVDSLDQRLAATYEHDRTSLAARLTELQKVAREARELLSIGASYAEERKLDGIVVTAEAEAEQIVQAIDHIDTGEVEAYAPPTPIAVSQADLGRGHGNDWLDTIVTDMIAESEQNDFEKTLSDDPLLLAAELDDAALADQGAARALALSHVQSKTAGFVGEEVAAYHDQFLARFEQARRRELKARTEITRKEAATSETNIANAPDEALFS